MINCRQYSDKWYSNLIAFTISNPLKTWWKARKYFKFPHISIKIYCDLHLRPYGTSKWRGKILDIDIQDVMWIDRYNTPSHRRNPFIYICLFRLLSLWITFYMRCKNEFDEWKDCSDDYWEYMLDYLYYYHDLKGFPFRVINSKMYNKIDFSRNITVPYDWVITPAVAGSLNKRGIKELKSIIYNSNKAN